MEEVKLWWYDPPTKSVPSGRNAGDYYGKWLLEKMGYKCIYSEKPDIITCGSILGAKTWSGNPFVWGSGFHNKADAPKKLSNIYAVRGKLSYAKLNTKKKIAVGDPGLLASKFYTPRTTKKYRYGIIPHYIDYKDIKERFEGINIPIIDIATDDIKGLLDQINECEFIFSTSLHGIIFSHSIGVPAIHIENRPLFSKENFKFKDYYSVFSIDYVKEKLVDVDFEKYLSDDPNLYRPSYEELYEVQENLLESFPLNRQVALCAVAKCENNYINDWVKYHIDLGVDRIFLYDNNDKDYEPIELRIDDDYLDRVTITKIPSAKKFQIDTYNKFYNEYRDKYNWIGFLDIDEFVVVNKWKNIKDFLNDPAFKDYNVIKLNWHLFGDDGKVIRDITVPVYEGITKRLTKHSYESHCKEFVRGGIKGKVEICSNHWCKIDDELPKQVMPDGNPTSAKISGARNCEEAYINHYMTKTLYEFIEQKLARGTDASFPSRVIDFDYFWKINDKTPEKLKFIENRDTSKRLKFCVGIISYIPDKSDVKKIREKRLRNLVSQIEKNFNIPIIIIAQNWKNFIVDSNNAIIYTSSDKLGITRARIKLREKFLSSEFDYMIMLDDDMELSDDPLEYIKYISKIQNTKREYYWVSNFLNNFSVISKNGMRKVSYDAGIDPEQGTGYEDWVFCERCKHDLDSMELKTNLPKYGRSHFLNDKYTTWVNPGRDESNPSAKNSMNCEASREVIRQIKGLNEVTPKKKTTNATINKKSITSLRHFY